MHVDSSPNLRGTRFTWLNFFLFLIGIFFFILLTTNIKFLGVEIQCIGHFGLIFGLLSARGYPEVQKCALYVRIYFFYY